MPQARQYQATVLVIDNNSTDRTAEMAIKAGAQVINETRQGVVYALQRGLREAKTELVAFTDADTVVDQHWLATIIAALAPADVVAVTGPVRFARLRILSWTRWFYRHQLLGSNMAIRRAAGLAAGGFDERYNLASDIAFGWALKNRGRIVYVPPMSVTTSSRRFQAQPIRHVTRYILNHVWMLLFHEPLFWQFTNIRKSTAELDRQANRRFWIWSSALFILILAYLSWWPSSSVFGTISVRGRTHQRLVAMTFDDGPNGAATRQIADILVAKKVPATFFFIGRNVSADPATARYVAGRGFTLGNHGWDTSYELAYDLPKTIAGELAKTNATILAAAGQAPIYFRPPHGLRSPQLLLAARRQHLRPVDWSIDGRDAMTVNYQKIVNQVVAHARPGSIIMLRDGVPRPSASQNIKSRQPTITALPVIIDYLRQRGYTFVSLGQLLPPETPEPTHTIDLG